MLRSLNSAISGLQNFQEEMDVIGNNIANVNTTAFKSARTDFADAFSETLRVSSGATGSTSGSSSIQVGSGVTTVGINNSYTQGAFNRTGITTDLAISGNGFFIVKDPTSGVQYATRAGNFHLDGTSGYLVTGTGERVQGFSDAGLTTLGDIKIDLTGEPATADPALTLQSYSIDGLGQIHVTLSDGTTTFVRGQVLMQNFKNPQGLVKEGNNLYSGISAAGGLASLAAAQTNGLGSVNSGELELSNVDLSNEMANLITAQRAFEANAKIVTTSDEMLQTLVNLKR